MHHVVRYGDETGKFRTRIGRHVDQLRLFAHIVLLCAVVMFVLCIALSWILENTDLLAVLSRQLPVAPGAVDRETFNAAAAVQSLDTLTAGLPVLIILLITAGALHPGHAGYQVTEVGQLWTSGNARHVDHRSVHRGEEGHMTGPVMPRKAVTKERRRTSHGLHLVLTICTLGAWGLLVWLPITLWHKFGPRKRTVTTYR